MVGFNYIRTPASQYARKLIAEGALATSHGFAANIPKTFLPTPTPPQLAHRGDANGTMGDLAPHMINAALALIGPIDS